MTRILIVEDHENISLSIKNILKNEGYQVESAKELREGRNILQVTKVNLVLLDWMLPDGQGIDFLMELRRNGLRLPVILLTARADLVDKVLGLELGANDYMTKPFEARELLARVRVQLRNYSSGPHWHSPTENHKVLTVGSLSIDHERHQVRYKSQLIELVKKEFELLMLLAESPEKVFSRDEILNKVWGYDIFPTTRTVDTHVMQIRQKTHVDLIETVRSVGYRLRSE